jgi:23S rRNA (uracil747-C5)-methyltransferase
MNTFCSYFNQGTCKSCDFITQDYSDQIYHKETKLREFLKNIKCPPLLPTVQSQKTHFRNKAKFIITGSIDNPVIGIAGEEALDEGVDLSQCSLHVNEITMALPTIKNFIKKANLSPYQMTSKRGELKGIILFYSELSQTSYLRFIVRSKEPIDRIRKFHKDLLNEISHLKCISINIQPISHAILEGEEEIFITEETSISHKLGNVEFELNPRAFVQTNQKIAEKLYSTVAEWIKESSQSRMVELYCGQGAFSFFSAPFIKESLGIEINPEAVRVANQTASKYHFSHLKFVAKDASLVGRELLSFNPNIVLVNPPRRGLGEAVKLLKDQKVEKIFYSSCNAESLAKDLEYLKDQYELTRIQIFDMFPNSHHFETLIELNLRSIKADRTSS